MAIKKSSTFKAIASVSDICQMLQVSRSRYYQLSKAGFLPQPKIDTRSNRPYFDKELQQKCLEFRETGIGDNGQIMMFYTPRIQKHHPTKRPAKKIDPVIQEYVETLEGMGLETTTKEVQAALNEIYPQGTNGEDNGLIIRELFRHLKQK